MTTALLGISVIVLVAVIMGISSVAPAIPLAYAEHPCNQGPGEQEDKDHACGPEQKPTCDEKADELREKGVPERAIERFLEHCVD